MSNHQTSKDLPNAIFSQESEDGQEPCSSPGGVQIDLFGQEALHVSLSRQQEKEREKMMSDTSGRYSLILLESAVLQLSLANKLQQLSDMDGSMIYKKTLKQKATPQRRVYYHLAASARTTKETGFSSPLSAWPTPTTRDYRDTGDLDKSRYRKDGKERLDTVPRIAFGVEKPSTAETESTAPSQLNPRFSLWLMGYPIEWAYCAERVTLSSRKSARK